MNIRRDRTILSTLRLTLPQFGAKRPQQRFWRARGVHPAGHKSPKSMVPGEEVPQGARSSRAGPSRSSHAPLGTHFPSTVPSCPGQPSRGPQSQRLSLSVGWGSDEVSGHGTPNLVSHATGTSLPTCLPPAKRWSRKTINLAPTHPKPSAVASPGRCSLGGCGCLPGSLRSLLGAATFLAGHGGTAPEGGLFEVMGMQRGL